MSRLNLHPSLGIHRLPSQINYRKHQKRIKNLENLKDLTAIKHYQAPQSAISSEARTEQKPPSSSILAHVSPKLSPEITVESENKRK
jgi:hypothetical protein